MEEKHIIHQNFDTTPRFLGIFNYTNIVISLFISVPLAYLIFKLHIPLNIKIYAACFVIFPIVALNLIFADSKNLFIYIYIFFRYICSCKIYIYSKVPLPRNFSPEMGIFKKEKDF